jgi:hypothetical protein
MWKLLTVGEIEVVRRRRRKIMSKSNSLPHQRLAGKPSKKWLSGKGRHGNSACGDASEFALRTPDTSSWILNLYISFPFNKGYQSKWNKMSRNLLMFMKTSSLTKEITALCFYPQKKQPMLTSWAAFSNLSLQQHHLEKSYICTWV